MKLIGVRVTLMRGPSFCLPSAVGGGTGGGGGAGSGDSSVTSGLGGASADADGVDGPDVLVIDPVLPVSAELELGGAEVGEAELAVLPSNCGPAGMSPEKSPVTSSAAATTSAAAATAISARSSRGLRYQGTATVFSAGAIG